VSEKIVICSGDNQRAKRKKKKIKERKKEAKKKDIQLKLKSVKSCVNSNIFERKK